MLCLLLAEGDLSAPAEARNRRVSGSLRAEGRRDIYTAEIDVMTDAWRCPSASYAPKPEALVGLIRIGNASPADAAALVEQLLREASAIVVPIDGSTGQEALRAFIRYGKGRHAAALYMGDCFAYVCARQLATPLLCKGNDFPRTDIELA